MVEYDFEKAWLGKFALNLDLIAGPMVRQHLLAGSEELSDTSSRDVVIDWTRRAIDRLERQESVEDCQAIMSGCACRYPTSKLRDLRKLYSETGDVDLILELLQQRFETFLREDLCLSEQWVREIRARGWGMAGVKEGNMILATKIPKSGNLVAYLQETDPETKRQLYCHCPRIRSALSSSTSISPVYCYCGAGYYKALWEEIFQEPVEVRLLSSVLQGDDVCQVKIHIPLD